MRVRRVRFVPDSSRNVVYTVIIKRTKTANGIVNTVLPNEKYDARPLEQKR